MQTLALVNPKKHHRRKARRMTAKQLQYFGKGRRRRGKARDASAAPARRRRRGSVAGRIRRHARRFAGHQGGAISLRGMNFNSFLRGTLVPSAVGAVGALGVDLALGYATPYLPTTLTTGAFVPLTKIAAAVGLGLVAQVASKDRRIAEQVTAGAITVVVYDYIRNMAKTQFPTLPLSEYVSGMGYAGPALTYPDGGTMGVYVGQAPAYNPSIAASRGGGTTRVVQPRLGSVDEYQEAGYTY
jgi:hypothetical protein